MIHRKFNLKPLTLCILAAITLSATVKAQDDVEEVTITGFKASLSSALNQKRESAAVVDSIMSEDIGKFPDSNLAESMQRIPGVALSRGDGGEGKTISVRGLGAEFTRVRINGMEGTSQTGSSDIYGAGNGGRSFDFNVFPAEIFSELTVRKTPSADVEEGSLGATVDLKAPKPLSLSDDLTMTGTMRGVFNEVSEAMDPRASFLISKKLAEDTFGVLASFAYSDRNIREVGYSAVNILPAYVNGGFCSPAGYTGAQNPANNATKGADALNCSTNNPRTGSLAAYQLLQSLTGVSGNPGGGAFFPRIPRYLNSEQDATRTGGTLTFEWEPNEDTNISLDNLYSEYDVLRHDNYIDALSLARNANNNGQPMMSIKELEVDSKGSLIYGLFDGVDLRSESLIDRFTSSFQQTNLNLTHQFSDTFEVNALIGRSESVFDNPERLTVNLDAIDTDNFAIDFRNGGNIPILSYGIDLTNPANFQYAAGLADGTVLGNWNTRRLERTTENTTMEVNFSWQFIQELKFKFGAQSRESDFKTNSLIIAPSFTATRNLPTGVTVADFTRVVNGVNDKLGSRTMGDYLGVDHEKWKEAIGFNDFVWCGAECGAQSPGVKETIDAGYLMAEFDFDLVMPLRGDLGIRYLETKQYSLGFIPTANPTGSTYPTTANPARVKRDYDELLPSTNVVVEINSDLQARFAYAEVMSRPELGLLIPSGSMNPTTRTASIGNPYLDPIRAETYDAALEWYFDESALVSAAYFVKDISTYIQSISSLVPYSELGLPNTLLEGSAATPSDLFTVNRSTNTPGGMLKGYELNLQLPLTFLTGFWQDFGVLANYTHVTSDINYVLQSSGGVPTLTTTNDLIGLSKNAASATLYYENELFSFRTTGSYRSGYLRSIPSGGNDSDVLGNHSSLFVDTSASYNLTDNVKLILEMQNLTDERNTLYIDSKRQDPLFETRIGRTLTLGVNAKF
jgi:iron complex outermembrane recepter protein